MEEALHKDSQAHAVIRASGKRQGWGLSGIRDRSRDGRSGLSGQAQPTWQGNTEIRCVRCFRRKEPWLFDGSPVLPRKGIFLWRISSACFFVSRFYGAAVERELQVRVLLYRPGACVSSFLRGLLFQRAPGKQKGHRSSDRRPCDGRWRKGRDLNPRYRFKPVYSLSRRAPSADSDTFPR